MQNRLLWALVAFYLITGLFISFAPFTFYQTGPGVSDTGPYNMHFLRDVGFAFTISAMGLAYGLWHRLKPLVLFGSAWLVVHGLFHLTLWVLHSHRTSTAALIDLAIVVAPAAVLAYLAVTYAPAASTYDDR